MKIFLVVFGVGISVVLGWWVRGYTMKTDWNTYNLKRVLGFEYYWHPERQGYVDQDGLVWFRFPPDMIQTRQLIHANIVVDPTQVVLVGDSKDGITLEKDKTYYVTEGAIYRFD